MSAKTIYSVDDTYDVHAEADKVFLDVLTTLEEPHPLTLDQVGDLINALEMAYSDAVDLQEAKEEADRAWKPLGHTDLDGITPAEAEELDAWMTSRGNTPIVMNISSHLPPEAAIFGNFYAPTLVDFGHNQD